MIKSRENPKKPHFWAILGQNWSKNIFFKNRAPSHLRVYGYPSLCKKSEKTNQPVSRKPHNQRTKEWIRGNSPCFYAFLGLNLTKKFFFKNWTAPYCRIYVSPSFCKKSEKTNDKISRKSQKTSFLGHFGPKLVQKIFFSKIGLRHIWGFMEFDHHAKNLKKLMSQSWEKRITDRRTDKGQFIGPNLYQVGPKKILNLI